LRKEKKEKAYDLNKTKRTKAGKRECVDWTIKEGESAVNLKRRGAIKMENEATLIT